MPRYITREGVPFEGETAAAAIDALRDTSRTPGRDRTHFLSLIAEGARMQTGFPVRATDCETVLTDLIAAGLVSRIQ